VASSRPLEQSFLEEAERHLARHAAASPNTSLARLEILEGAASVAGNWSLPEFRRRHLSDYQIDPDLAKRAGGEIIEAIARTHIPEALALSSLARLDMDDTDRRQAGAYYTDFRLSQYVANGLIRPIAKNDLVIDPAAGTGILLAAAALTMTSSSRSKAGHFVESQACAADLDANALRGTRIALGSMTDSLDAIDALDHRLRVHDSLLSGLDVWRDVAPSGFHLIIGNPPWEKLKATRHEYLQATGSDRHYGDDTAHNTAMNAGVESARLKLSIYVNTLATRFPGQSQGEPDLYKAFLSLAFELVRPGGQLGLLVPAGLIRSDGTQALRRMLLENSSDLRLTVFDNRPRFFAIDTRFKFLAVHATTSSAHQLRPLQLDHASGTIDSVSVSSSVRMSRKTLARTRPDLTVPEVRSTREWRLFVKMHESGPLFGAPEGWWQPSIMREVDMTRDRPMFTRSQQGMSLAVVEGRMVHQFRTGAKVYESGTGRRAVWKAQSPGRSALIPQFWIAHDDLSPGALRRTGVARVGFCDITGQTNERSMLASLIPSNVVCGNKVPTILFHGSEMNQDDDAFLWLAIANSLAFDWLLRRTITTTVNYFLLLSMPMPAGLTTQSLAGRRLIKLSRRLITADTAGNSYNPQATAAMRAEIDTRVAEAYGLDASDLALMLKDFPLLDRGQPAIHKEERSTVTRDQVLALSGVLLGPPQTRSQSRAALAGAAGATAYVPADYRELSESSDDQSAGTGA
jgi:hypothetical protein